MPTATAKVEIVNAMGIHLRPASNLVQLCNEFPDCEVEITKEGTTVNAKSIMSVIMLAAEKGSTLEIAVEGEGCEALLGQMIALIEGKFGEED